MVISEEEINNILPVVNVLPLMSVKSGRKIYPNEVLMNKKNSGLDKDSIVLCFQIRTLDKKRLIKQLGKVDDIERQEAIIEALSFQLGIDR